MTEPEPPGQLTDELKDAWVTMKDERAFRRRWGFWLKDFTTDAGELAAMPVHTRQAMQRYAKQEATA